MIHLITENEIKNLTDISSNVDATKFCHYIQIAQDKQVKTIIGTSCYNDLLDAIENDTLTPAQLILLNGDNRSFQGIKIGLAWWILWYSYPNLNSSVRNIGVTTQSDENFDPVAPETLRDKRYGAKGQAEYYMEEVRCYLSDNTDVYPCFNENDDCCNERQGSGYGSSSGIVLDLDSAGSDYCPHCSKNYNRCRC